MKPSNGLKERKKDEQAKPVGEAPREATKIKFGIIGAGAAGLFTGTILDWLNEQSSDIQFSYDILEASERAGGRLYTCGFSGEGQHQYYDFGAMRFPDNPVMKRTFDLFKHLGMERKPAEGAKKGDLIPYYISNDFGAWHFDDITKWRSYKTISTTENDPWRINEEKKIDATLLKTNPDEVFNIITKPLRDQLKKDLEAGQPSEKGWELLMKYDNYSTRSFLALRLMISGRTKKASPSLQIITRQSSGWKRSIVEQDGTTKHSAKRCSNLWTLNHNPNTDWRCILGGSQVLAEKMKESLKINQQGPSRLELNKPVTKVKSGGARHMEITVKGEKDPELSLNYALKHAIRTLTYGPSAKVRDKVKRAWWIQDLGKCNLKKAGLGHSNLRIRTCVYPSYNLYDPKCESAVLLCSYTWQQDALRLASLISRNPDPKRKLEEEEELKKVLIRDLARLHANPEHSEAELLKLIQDNYIEHYTFNWDQKPHSVGAFAFFSPQQFRSLWSKMIQPSGDFSVFGEAASPHHAWVVGALESGVHAVHTWITQYKDKVPGLQELKVVLEESGTDCPYQSLPPYVEPNTSSWHAFLAMAIRDKSLFGAEKDSDAQ